MTYHQLLLLAKVSKVAKHTNVAQVDKTKVARIAKAYVDRVAEV